MLIKVFQIIMAIKTNAIKEYNTAVVNQSGRIGTVRCYTKNRLTYVRAASNSSVTNNRTNSQMTQRLLFSSLAPAFVKVAELSASIVANNEGWNKRPLFSKERIMKKADSKMYETSLDCFLQGFCLLSPDVYGVCSVDAEDACLLHVNV